MAAVRVGVLDVGANTLRLLVAAGGPGALVSVREERVQLGLGEEIEASGSIPAAKLAEVAEAARREIGRARRDGCDRIEILVTSPGRQAENAEELVAALVRGSGLPVRVLSAEEEARLGWIGAVDAAALERDGSVGVCDVGGGSTQVVIGTPRTGPAWSRSFDIGSLRLTRRLLADDPPSAAAVAEARAEVERELGSPALPIPQSAVATGGTARALRRVVGEPLGEQELEEAIAALAARRRRRIAKDYGFDEARARTLLAGTIILAAVRSRLGVPLEVGRGGVREGAAVLLLAETAAASA